MALCNVCFRKCDIPEGGLGFCGARTCRSGIVTAANYGKVTSLALDPIEKKPLRRFHPGSMILSVGSYGCNLRCPFCQNHEISWSNMPRNSAGRSAHDSGKASHRLPPAANSAESISPEELAAIALSCKDRGNIGVAFTYNEPLIGYEYVRDTAKLVHESGMVNVMVTNGTANLSILAELLPYIDAMNIDLKGFTDRYYNEVLGGNRRMVMDFIEEAVKHCHVELTTLIVPGENDSEEEMRELSAWVAGLSRAGTDDLVRAGTTKQFPTEAAEQQVEKTKTGSGAARCGRDIPLHISRFFPRFHMTDRDPTSVRKIYRLADIAHENLTYVYTGNC